MSALPVNRAQLRKLLPSAVGRDEVLVIYDGQCPVCTSFVTRTQVLALGSSIRLVDARHSPGLVAGLRQAGFDLNATFLVATSQDIFVGSEAMSSLSRLDYTSKRWAYLLTATFGDGRRREWLYRLLTRLRRALLLLLGRAPL